MARVSDSEVKSILDTTIDTTPFITTASLVVDEELDSSGLSEARLTQIELYLAAHFACLMDPRVASESVDGASNTYEGKTGMGLDRTSYGQQVKLLDTSGALVSMDQKKASITTIRSDLTRNAYSLRRQV